MRPLQPLEVPLEGVQLIEASAGTGKTFAITTLVLRAVLEAERRIGEILVVTFTVAATAELRSRVRDRLRRAAAALADPAAAGDDADLRALVERRQRIADPRADRARVQAALNEFDEAPIFTIHGFCQRVLHEFAFECGSPFDVDLIADPRLPLADAVRDYWTRTLSAAGMPLVERLTTEKITLATVAALAATFATHRDLRVRCTPPPDAAADPVGEELRARLRAAGPEILAALDRRKAVAGVQDFNDLLHRVEQAVHGVRGDALCQAVRRRYPLALVDECQDTDPVQYRIFRRVYGGATDGGGLFLIGDPKQAIYAFRGADVFAYLRARRDATAAHSLRTNWRSSPRLVQAVNAVFGGAADPFVLRDIGFTPAEPAPPNVDALGGALAGQAPLRVLFAARSPALVNRRNRFNKSELDWYCAAVADAIAELLDGRSTIAGARIRPGDVAVLTRTNRQLSLIQEALQHAAVPSVILGDTSVFDTSEAAILERLLAALVDPGNAAALRAALVTPLVGLTGDDLRQLADDEAAWETWIERFHRWAERWRTTGFTAAFRGILDELDAPARVLARDGGERCLTNVLHLGELLQQAASEGRRGPHALLEWLHRMRCDPGERERAGDEATQLRLESDVNAVTLTTVHKSKGLEYPVVVCPFTWDAYRPQTGPISPPFHTDDDERLCIDVSVPPGPDSLAQAAHENAAEAARLLYVALTRARQLCLVPWGAFTYFEDSAAARLLHGSGDAGPRDAAAIGALSDDALRADLAALAARAPGAIAIEPLRLGRRLRYAPEADTTPALVAPLALAPVPQRWRLSSFTAITAGAEPAGIRAQDGVDRDELAQRDDAAPSAPGALRGFPRGRGPGTFVHSIFEHLDFIDPDPEALRAVVERQIGASRIGREWVAPLCTAIRDVLDTPLTNDPRPLRLCEVARTRRLNELEFALPVALDAPAAARAPRALTSAALADVFARHGDAALAPYAARLRRLPMPAWSGYLTGFIDCVLEHDGRWYVIDYKTNDLGDAPHDYAPARLAGEMVRHDYVLQAHLYLVALHRYLARRLPAYAYERHVGGALYLFVRGMAPARGPATGVVAARPSLALIEALSALFAGAAA